MKEVVELFASFARISDSLNVPCDITPETVRKEHEDFNEGIHACHGYQELCS